MNPVVEFGIVAGAVIVSIVIAVGLEWLGLAVLLRLMPAPRSSPAAKPSANL